MYKARKEEKARMSVLFRKNADIYLEPLIENDMKYGRLDTYKPGTYMKWDDVSITVGYLDYVLRRITKYGLHYGSISKYKFPNYKEELKKDEDKLVEYFLYEMRKEPAEQKEIPTMPIN